MKTSSDKKVPLWLNACKLGVVIFIGTRVTIKESAISELAWTAILVVSLGLVIFGLMTAVTEVLSRRRSLTQEIQKEQERFKAEAATRASP